MSGRFVRQSKYRHVHGEAPKKDKSYSNIRPETSGDTVCGNEKFVACALQGGGGPVLVHPREKYGRVDHNPPNVNVHKAKVLDFAFSPFNPNLLGTASEDCYARITVVPDELDGNVTEAAATLEGHQKKVSFLNFNPTAENIVATASHDQTLICWNFEAQAEVARYETPDFVQSFAWNDDGSMIGTTTKDKKIRIYDPRAPDSVTETDGFPGGKASKFIWMDNHGKIAVVGFSRNSTRQYSVFDPRKMGEGPLDTTDIDQSAGVIMTHYDPDTSILFLGGKGDGNIRYFEVVDEEPYIHFLSEYRSSESQKGLGFLPKRACDVSKCEIAVGLRLMRDWICPISFQVPRKSDLFQPDIYPETYAGIPALSADEWLAGENKPAPKVSMKPGEGGDRAVAAFAAKKSPAELTAELAAANARIAELEAELAKLKQ